MTYDRMPYTYVVRHKPTGRYYYGSRTAKGCHPKDLFVKYFTSSQEIKDLIKTEGLDVFEVEVRKVFNDGDKARKWETRVLRRIIDFPLVVNKHTTICFSNKASSDGAKRQWEDLKKGDPEKLRELNERRGKATSKTIKEKRDLGLNVMKRSSDTCSKGGKTGGKKTAENYLTTARSKENVSRYMSKSSWITNGFENKRLPIDEAINFLLNNSGWYKGMTKQFNQSS